MVFILPVAKLYQINITRVWLEKYMGIPRYPKSPSAGKRKAHFTGAVLIKME